MTAQHFRFLRGSLVFCIIFFSACGPMRTANNLSPTSDNDPDVMDDFANQLGGGNVQDYQDAVKDLPNMKSSGQVPDELDAYLEGPWNSSEDLPAGWTPSTQSKKIGDTLDAVIKTVNNPQMAQALSVFRDRIKAEIATAKNVKTPEQRQQYQSKIQGLLQKFMGSAFGNPAKKSAMQAKVQKASGVLRQQTAQIQQRLAPIRRR